MILQKPVSLQLTEALGILTYDVTELLTQIMNTQKSSALSSVFLLVVYFKYSGIRDARTVKEYHHRWYPLRIYEETDLWMIIKRSVEERAGEVIVSQMYTHTLTDMHRHLLIAFGPAIHSCVYVDFLSAFSL